MKGNEVYTKLFLWLSLKNYPGMNYWKISTTIKKKNHRILGLEERVDFTYITKEKKIKP